MLLLWYAYTIILISFISAVIGVLLDVSGLVDCSCDSDVERVHGPWTLELL